MILLMIRFFMLMLWSFFVLLCMCFVVFFQGFKYDSMWCPWASVMNGDYALCHCGCFDWCCWLICYVVFVVPCAYVCIFGELSKIKVKLLNKNSQEFSSGKYVSPSIKGFITCYLYCLYKVLKNNKNKINKLPLRKMLEFYAKYASARLIQGKSFEVVQN